MFDFCPNCDEKLPSPNLNFCPYCGSSLKEQPDFTLSEEVTDKDEGVTSRAIYELGEKLEECVEKILFAKGYEVKRRVRCSGSSGVAHEIDVWARRGKIVKIVECKNWKHPVGKEVIQKLNDTIKDLGSRLNGIVASYAGFTEDARELAEHYGIELWGPEYLAREFFKVIIGRINEAGYGATIKVRNALQVRVNFLKASDVKLQNKDRIMVNGTLSYYPYYIVDYSYFAKFKDPTKQVHTFNDSGKIFIDGLNGIILNPSLSVLQRFRSSDEGKRNKKLVEELQRGSFIHYEIRSGEDYKIELFQPTISKRSVKKLAINYIVQKNTREIVYMPKGQETTFFPEMKVITYTPKISDINIKNITLVYVPEWEINYEVFNKIYVRKVLAFSGEILEDTLKYCPEHIGFLKKETIAICEVCGYALCGEHISQCAICGKWLCKDDGTFCEECRKIFCKEHTLLNCEICNQLLCNNCKLICPICKKTYGQKHVDVCYNCGRKVCSDCVIKTGLIRRKTLCKECQEN
jgi:hypothetical protein